MVKQGYFNPEHVEQAQIAIQDWAKKHPQAAAVLGAIWTTHLMTAGHKTMGREIVALFKGKELK